MAKNLEKLLGESLQTRIALHELQRMAGDDSDVRLIADILARGHSIIRALGFDPSDTTAPEVYQALMALAPRIEQVAWAKASEWVLMDFDGQVISFHPIDIIENYHHQLPLGQHKTYQGRRGLGYEITRRYTEHPATHNETVERVVCQGGICYTERAQALLHPLHGLPVAPPAFSRPSASQAQQMAQPKQNIASSRPAKKVKVSKKAAKRTKSSKSTKRRRVSAKD